jgi:hypothetical protein
LKTVNRPATTTAKYGEGTISGKCIFEDALISLSCIPNDGRTFDIILKNKGDSSIKLKWDDGSIVDADGVAHQISHSTVKIIDIGKSQPTTTIPKASSFTESVFPADKVSYDSVLGYYIVPMVPIGDAEARKGYIGKNIRLILPIEIEGITNEYTFVFELGAVPDKPKSAKSGTDGKN